MKRREQLEVRLGRVRFVIRKKTNWDMDLLLTDEFSWDIIERLRASWYCLTLSSAGNFFSWCFACLLEGKHQLHHRYNCFFSDILRRFVATRAGNDPELDPNRPPEPPTKAIDRPTQRVGKRDAPKELPAQQPRAETTTNNRRGPRAQGNEAGRSIHLC